MEEPGGEHGAGVAGGDDRVGLARADGAHSGDEARVRLRPHGLRRLLRHLDPIGRLDERQPACVEPGGAVERDLDPVLRRLQSPRDDLVRGAVTA